MNLTQARLAHDRPLSARRLEIDEFRAERQEVLAQRAGTHVDLEEAVAYLRALPSGKNCAVALCAAKAGGDLLLQPRAAVPTIGGQIALLRCLQDEGVADILPTQVDSYSRLLQFDRAQAGLEESEKTGQSKLNGFPFVAHGVAGTRQVTEALRKPMCMRQVTPDIRLVAEVALAGWPTAQLDAEDSRRVRNGLPVALAALPGEFARACDEAGALLAVLRRTGDAWRPEKVFF